ncbi:ROK family transcriptional regulator [Paenibacillus pinihumi]|uniref:ROK family transcriptional regulator n=1 Tax=Paenibacillus pinihumi TaxID=669462 RepID=UPI0004093DE0|nr:ROK family transcriptional regulator [Paenibacillus pinihumi]
MKHDQDFIKRQNRLTVFEMIKTQSPISRAMIAKKTGMSPTTVSRIVGELTEQGYVIESEQVSEGLGRKSTLLGLMDASVSSIGIELDRHVLNIGVVDLQGNLVHSESHERGIEEAPEVTVQRISDVLEHMLERGIAERKHIVGIGVGLPGIIDNGRGVVVFSVQLGWKNVALSALLEEATGLKVKVDNELKVKALAEHLKGSAIGSNRTALLGFGNGVGSALIFEGEIYRGEMNSAGEIGHTTVDPNGPLCQCGKAGCLQTYITIHSLLQEASQIRPIQSVEELFAARAAGERWAIHLIDRALTYMAITVNNVVCMYNPDTVIFSGELTDKFPEMYEEVKERCHSRFVWEPLRDSFRFVTSQLHEAGVMIGSGLQAQAQFFKLD